MAGAISAAVHGAGAFTPDVVAVVTSVNDLRLEPVAAALLRLRG